MRIEWTKKFNTVYNKTIYLNSKEKKERNGPGILLTYIFYKRESNQQACPSYLQIQYKLEFGVFSRTHTLPSLFCQNLGRSMHFTAPIMKNNEKGEVTKRTKIAKGHNSCSWTIKNQNGP